MLVAILCSIESGENVLSRSLKLAEGTFSHCHAVEIALADPGLNLIMLQNAIIPSPWAAKLWKALFSEMSLLSRTAFWADFCEFLSIFADFC